MEGINLSKSLLFDGISKEDIAKLCKCLSAREKKLNKGAFVFQAGEKIGSVYVLLSGSVHIVDSDLWGNQAIVETMHAYDFFGEAYVFAKADCYLVSVQAAEDIHVLVLNPKLIDNTCVHDCECHQVFSRNVVRIMALKIVRLTQKLTHVVRRTTREKLLSYLSQRAQQTGSSTFEIPYSRQQLADYLSVERSAMSHELGKMRDAGIVKYHKNHFELLYDE